MTQKTIKEVVSEFKQAFGLVEFKATNFETGQVGGSKGWQEPSDPALEITGSDYLALGNMGKQSPAQGVLAGILKLNNIGKR